MRRPWIDGHLDLAYLALIGNDLLHEAPEGAAHCVTLPALRLGRVGVVLGTLFTEAGAPDEPVGYAAGDADGARAAALRQLERYRLLEQSGALRIVRTRADLDAPSPLRLVLLMEGADPIRDADDVRFWHDAGVRAVGLAWARGTRWAGGNGAPGGITAEGRGIVAALDRAGILHDASHLSDEGFEDLFRTTDRLVVASHSNCRAITGNSQRHLTDAQVEAIGARGGVVGLNLFGRFLTAAPPGTAEDAVAHVERVARLAGHAATAMGSDLDGGFPPSDVPAGLRGPQHYDALANLLLGRGWSEEQVSGFAQENWLRVLRASLPA